MNQLVILVPTYNEAISILELLEKLENFRVESKYKFDLVVIDDNSPDRTAEIVEKLAITWVQVMKRSHKDGLGAAYRAGILKVLGNAKYTHIVTMDADGSHRVEDLPAMFLAMESSTSKKSMVLGTRWMPGGRVVNWPKFRQLLSRSGTKYAKLALGMNLDDLTGGFRIYSSELLNSIKINEMNATGYCFQIEMAMAAEIVEAETVQVPITFIERSNGKSKMSGWIAIEALNFITKNGIKRILVRSYRR